MWYHGRSWDFPQKCLLYRARSSTVRTPRAGDLEASLKNLFEIERSQVQSRAPEIQVLVQMYEIRLTKNVRSDEVGARPVSAYCYSVKRTRPLQCNDARRYGGARTERSRVGAARICSNNTYTQQQQQQLPSYSPYTSGGFAR